MSTSAPSSMAENMAGGGGRAALGASHRWCGSCLLLVMFFTDIGWQQKMGTPWGRLAVWVDFVDMLSQGEALS